MEYTETEVQVVSRAISKASDAQVQDLNDLELALVGGGIGEASLI
jgi:hypothetical protein